MGFMFGSTDYGKDACVPTTCGKYDMYPSEYHGQSVIDDGIAIARRPGLRHDEYDDNKQKTKKQKKM